MRIWELATGRCARTIFAHDDKKFVSCLSWGRQHTAVSAPNGIANKNNNDQSTARLLNVVATASWDKVHFTPTTISYRNLTSLSYRQSRFGYHENFNIESQNTAIRYHHSISQGTTCTHN
jgi:hypothetical protein